MAELDTEKQQEAKAYAGTMRRLLLAELLLAGAVVLVLLFTPLSIGLRNLLSLPQPLRVALYFIVLTVCVSIVFVPFTFYGGFVVPRRFGILTQGLREWLVDDLKSDGMGLLLGTAVIVFIYWLLGALPELWWLAAAGCVVLLAVVLTNVAPVLIVPLFYKSEPLTDEELRERLERLAEKAGTRVRGVFTIDLSSKGTMGNAALVGMGNTRRIVLGDTLLDEYSPDEVEVIMAHELGHHAHRDIVKLMAIQAAFVVGGFYLAHLALEASVAWFGFGGIDDVAAFPLLATVMAVLALALAPLRNAYSRRIERAADAYALAMTDKPREFITAMTKLANQNLAEARPGRWVEVLLYDHPPYYRRVAMAEGYAKGEE